MKILGLDDYDLQARLAPALLTVLPVALLAGVWTAKAWSAVSGVVTGLGAAVALAFLLAQFARAAGKRIERDLLGRLGDLPTTLALRHGGPLLNLHTRDRYHAFLSAKIGSALPTEAEQADDPVDANMRFQSAVDWLRKHAVDEKDALVRTELMGYGFCRNLVGLKPIALAVLCACITANAVALYFVHPRGDNLITDVVLEAVLVLALPLWLFVGPGFAEAAAWAYARRLLSLCEGKTTSAISRGRPRSPPKVNG